MSQWGWDRGYILYAPPTSTLLGAKVNPTANQNS
jgi:hypothetical protein